MQVKIPVQPVVFPVVLAARLVGFALGAVVSLSGIGLALAGATGGFGYSRQIVASTKLDKDTHRITLRTSPGWLVRLLGGGTRKRDYYVSSFAYGEPIIETRDGKVVSREKAARIARMFRMYQREF